MAENFVHRKLYKIALSYLLAAMDTYQILENIFRTNFIKRKVDSLLT
jgi:hypothetical protein